MKACLFGELSKLLEGSGIGTALKQQRIALELNGVQVTHKQNELHDIMHINTIGPYSAYTTVKTKLKKTPCILHTHTTCEDAMDSFRYSEKIAPHMKKYLKFLYGKADRLICPTEYTKKIIENYGIDVPADVISNGVDLEKFRYSETARDKFRNKYKIEGVTVYCVGHIFKRKGILDYLNLAKKNPKNKFLWIGRDYGDLVEEEIKNAYLNAPKNVHFTGYVPDIAAANYGCDIFLFPSYVENQGIAILEAAACCRPLILRDIPAYDGWLKDGENCLKAKNKVEFQKHLKSLIEDEDERLRLGKNAFKMSQNHSLKKVGQQLKETYEKTMEC